MELSIGTVIHYEYDARGVKHSKVVDDGSPDTTHYAGPFHYTNGTLQFMQHAEGRALKSGSHWTYEYNLPDHLGNVRVTVDENGNVVQRDDYYPFGGTFNSSAISPENLYQYQGKEEQKELNTYDFEARMYDQWLARTWQIDPMASKYYFFSPYSWVANNPILLTDPTGMEIDLSGLDKKDRRIVKKALRQHKSSGTYKNLYKQIKKSDSRYVVNLDRSGEMGLKGGTFDGNFSFNTGGDTDPDTGETLEGLDIQNAKIEDEFAPNEKGGIITLNADLLGDDPADLSHLLVEEVVHAAQYDDANKGQDNPTGLLATADVEFEAKAIVGQIASESRNRLVTTRVDKLANGIGTLLFRTGKINNSHYSSTLSKWHSHPDNPYRTRPIRNSVPTLLITMITN